eukprot:CAMPEP_0201709650 /NCGR_PEP_ID=MMETSP0578-20130828/58210_1 /ASSEMBLY_ACC=CAM_ASM_000663 /TAXON_ID=267565 /ORGANISM="Skeletonema grethea, Strain CCMP 1804" /LENGTH=59 /DNA_ID=CAMNT_0048198631 /DNA_START=470 /DNA_END=649 /DNA_ORIENTATION=-
MTATTPPYATSAADGSTTLKRRQLTTNFQINNDHDGDNSPYATSAADGSTTLKRRQQPY